MREGFLSRRSRVEKLKFLAKYGNYVREIDEGGGEVYYQMLFPPPRIVNYVIFDGFGQVIEYRLGVNSYSLKVNLTLADERKELGKKTCKTIDRRLCYLFDCYKALADDGDLS